MIVWPSMHKMWFLGWYWSYRHDFVKKLINPKEMKCSMLSLYSKSCSNRDICNWVSMKINVKIKYDWNIVKSLIQYLKSISRLLTVAIFWMSCHLVYAIYCIMNCILLRWNDFRNRYIENRISFIPTSWDPYNIRVAEVYATFLNLYSHDLLFKSYDALWFFRLVAIDYGCDIIIWCLWDTSIEL